MKITEIIAALFLATGLLGGLLGAGYFVGQGLTSIGAKERFVTVKGLAERAVLADSASAGFNLQASGNDLAQLYKELEAQQKKLAELLASKGFATSNINLGVFSSSTTSSEDRKNDPSLPMYQVSATVLVSDNDVQKIASLVAEGNQLMIQAGGYIVGVYANYAFGGLSAIRAEMIAEATKDARNAAQQFAADSGSKVGAIRNASQGVFSIGTVGGDYDDSTQINKRVRVVTTVDYYLKD